MSLRPGSRFRARPIDINKKIPVYHTDKPEEFEDEITVSRALPQLTTGMLQEDEQELFSNIDFDNDNKDDSFPSSHPVIDLKTIEIPIPHCRIVVPPPLAFAFKKPVSYIRTKLHSVENDEFDSGTVEYDLESDDERFVEDLKKSGHNISESVFERCIDRLEKETARLREIKDAKDVFAPPGCVELSSEENHYGNGFNHSGQNSRNKESNTRLRPVELQYIYEYWFKKRTRRDKALIRRFVDPPEMNDPSPYVAFRPRHKTFSRSRRRNDLSSFRKLQELRVGLQRLQLILELVRRRERLKEQYFVNRSEILSIQIAQHKQAILSQSNGEIGGTTTSLTSSTKSNDRTNTVKDKLKLKAKVSATTSSGGFDDVEEEEEDDDSSEDSDSSVENMVLFHQGKRPATSNFIESQRKRPMYFRSSDLPNPSPSPSFSSSSSSSPPHHPFTMFARVGRGGRIIQNRQFLLNKQDSILGVGPTQSIFPLSTLKTNIEMAVHQMTTSDQQLMFSHDRFKILLTKELLGRDCFKLSP